jgi:hypothetical protein
MATSSERVRRHRERRAEKGLIRFELYVSPEILAAVQKYAVQWEDTRPTAMRSLILVGLRTEGLLPAPDWFRDRILQRFR